MTSPTAATTNDRVIRDEMIRVKDVYIFGWEATQFSRDVFLVTYSHKRPAWTTQMWPFEVDLRNEIVRFMAGDHELLRKYKLDDRKT